MAGQRRTDGIRVSRPSQARRQRLSRGHVALLALAVALPACTAAEGRPPVARIELTPDQLGENDGFQTAVTLDGRASADPVDHPEGAELTYAWEILDDEVRFEPGSHTDDAAPVVRFRADRPATIILTVTDADGLSASTTAHLRLTASP